MVDSTNPRVLADNIKMLAARGAGSTVEANPTGAATAELEKLGVGGTVYGIPTYTPPAFSTTEVDTGVKWIDGSPIYTRVYTPVSAIQLSTQATGTDITSAITNVSDIDLIIEASALYGDNSSYLPLTVDINNGAISAYTFIGATVDTIILKYIKATS